ncbi:hypothetical protein KY290_008027 [Solanum tuberosum]|uniref:Retrotransposon Copia-like N-terminal domain-containing protein n=1 Tax=Solanum tuberosum TaxID=4113 RepID=A0ABQ7W781_SOLTU|nr:hypothetical protein KY290_008027 [Solanum tuberosum]
MPSAIEEVAVATVTIETLEVIESKRNHPLYLHPSNTLGCALTSGQLTRAENYALWSRSMLITLRAKSKIGFVLGTCRKKIMHQNWRSNGRNAMHFCSPGL